MKTNILKNVALVAVACSALLGICHAQPSMEKIIITDTYGPDFQAKVDVAAKTGWKIVDGSLQVNQSSAFFEGTHHTYTVIMENTNGAPIPTATPEPSALALSAIGLLAFAFYKSRLIRNG